MGINKKVPMAFAMSVLSQFPNATLFDSISLEDAFELTTRWPISDDSQIQLHTRFPQPHDWIENNVRYSPPYGALEVRLRGTYLLYFAPVRYAAAEWVRSIKYKNYLRTTEATD